MEFNERVLRHAPWSISKGKVLGQCARQYAFKYVQKLKESRKSASSRIGSAAHKVLERARPTCASGATLDQIVEEVAASDEFALTRDEHVQVAAKAAAIEDYVQRAERFKERIGGVKCEFVEYQLAIGHDLRAAPYFDNARVLLRGVIDDALWTRDDVLVVIDHKSGRRDDVSRHAEQFRAYMLLALGNHPDLVGVQCAVHYIGSPELVWLPRVDGTPGAWTRADVERHVVPWFGHWLDGMTRRLAIVDAGDPPPETGWACEYCGYVDRCPEGTAHVEERRTKRGGGPNF